MDEIAHLKKQLAKKTPSSVEILTPKLELAQLEAKLAKNQLDHAEAEVRDLRGSCEELQAIIRHLTNGEAEIARL